MFSLVLIFRVLLALVAAYAFWRGGRDERLVAALCVVGALATTLALAPLPERYVGVEASILAIDLAMLAAFVAIALRSTRFWPLWIAGLQLTTIFGHLLKALGGDLVPKAYGVALGFWAYPIIFILAVATWRRARICGWRYDDEAPQLR